MFTMYPGSPPPSHETQSAVFKISVIFLFIMLILGIALLFV